jgi:hypothetical protein
MSTINYVNTNEGDALAYPYVLRVTFGETPSMFFPNSLLASQLSSDIDNLVSNESSITGVAIASDPTVPPGAQAVTIDFAPTSAFASVSVAQILSQIQSALMGALEFLSNTAISRVEKVNANAAQGNAGAVARGAASGAVETAQAGTSFTAQLSAFLGNAQNLLLVGALVAGLFYFGPEIKAAVRGMTAKRRTTA